MPSPIVPRRILAVALVVLVVVHLLPMDVWPVPGDPTRVVLGFLPYDVAWHLGWMLAATVVVIYMTGPPWPDEPAPARRPPLTPPDHPRPEGHDA